MDFPSFLFHKEVQDYLHSCENLLAAMSTPNIASDFSKEEREILWYSVGEVQKVLVLLDKK